MIRPTRFTETKAQPSRTPFLNYIERISDDSWYSDYAQIAKKKRLQYLVLRTPELAGMLWDITEDIVGRYNFKPTGRGTGRNRVIGAQKWARKAKLKEMMMSAVFDALSAGEGYLYLGAKAAKIREEINKVMNEQLVEKLYDESVYSPLFQPISTSTITNTHDEHKLTGYVQRISGSDIRYAPREIIHLYFKRMAGRVEGFTLVSTIPVQLELLWLLWTNQYDLQAKGNMPDLIVTAKDVKSNTPALKDVENKLRKYNMPGNSKHGTTLLYGSDYNFERMERDTNLQFEDVGKAITSVMASLFRYPKHRLAWMPKEAASNSDSQGNGDRDYWDLIMKLQDTLRDVLDSQLFEPYFGVQLFFEKSYKHDSIVENQAMRSRIDNANLINSMLRQDGKQIPSDMMLQFISGKQVEFDLEKMEEADMEMFAEQEQLSLEGTPPKQKNDQRSAEKKLAEDNMQKNTGGVRKQ